MAMRHESALRQHRRSLRAQQNNQRNAARLRTGVKKIRSIIAAGDSGEAKKSLNDALSLIDHSVSRKALHRNAAARLKSRLTRQVTALGK